MPRRHPRTRTGRSPFQSSSRVLESLESRLAMAADAAVWAGDANADGRFDSADLVLAFQHGKYESGKAAHWDQGDWNLDGRFTTTDLVAAFQTGRYGRTRNAEPNPDDATGGSEVRDPNAGDPGAGGPIPEDPGAGDAGSEDPVTGDPVRDVTSGNLANDDWISRNLPANSRQVPSLNIDVLANDSASVVEIRSIGDSMLGTVERVPGAGPNGRELLRYIPGPQFRYWDRFTYTVADAEGNEVTASVWLNFTQDSGASQFAVQVPDAIATDAGTPIELLDEAGDPLLQVDYEGPSDMTVGMYIYWAAPDVPYSGDVFAGKFSSSVPSTATGGFSEIAGGGAWVYGTVSEVNQLLAGMRYEPAAGFTTTNGYRVNINTYLYSSLRISVGMESSSFRVLVRAPEGSPKAVDDVFESFSLATGSPIELDVTGNDYADGRNLLGLGEVELVSVDKSDYSHGTLELDPATGKVVYTPDWSYNGLDTFSYLIRNAEGVLSQGRAAIRGNVLMGGPFVDPGTDATDAGDGATRDGGTDAGGGDAGSGDAGAGDSNAAVTPDSAELALAILAEIEDEQQRLGARGFLGQFLSEYTGEISESLLREKLAEYLGGAAGTAA